MAYNTSAKYKNNIYTENYFQSLMIKINNNIIDPDYIRDINYDNPVFESDSFTLGSTAIGKFEIEVDNIVLENIDNISELEVNYYMQYENNDTEIIPFGKYVLKNITNNGDNYTKLTFNDYMDKFNTEIDISSVVPCTRFELLEYICETIGVELYNESIINGDVIVDVYDSSITAKTYISFIAERSAGFAKITRDNKLIIKSFNNVDEINIPDNMVGEYTTDEKKIIKKVIYENATQKYEAGQDGGETIFLSSDSLFTCTQEEVDNIYNVLNGLEFRSLDLQIWGDPSIDAGDIIVALGMKSFAQMNWKFSNGFYGNYKTTLKKSNQLSHVDKIPSKARVRRIQSTLDEQELKINLLIQETDENTENLTQLSMETSSIQTLISQMDEEQQENFNRIVMELAQTILNIQNTGGSNLIKNSVMFSINNGVPSNWELVGDGTVSATSSAEAKNNGSLSGNIFILKNLSVKQRISVKQDSNDIPEEEKTYYSFSTKIKKNADGYCYVKISNSNEEYIIRIEEGDSSNYGNYELKKLLPKDTYYDIEFFGSDDSNAAFTDNMFALGSYASQWTQASGEIMNTQVVVDENGLLVKSSVYDGDYTTMNPLEFAGYANINGSIIKVFTLNRDTTEVTKLNSKEEITMNPIKIVPVESVDKEGWAFVPSNDGGGI